MRLSEKRLPGCNSGKLHENRNNSAPRQHFLNRKKFLVTWIVDGGVDTKIRHNGAVSEAWWLIEVDEVLENCQFFIITAL